MIATQAVHNEQNVRRIYYFSLEYLMGRLFGNNLLATRPLRRRARRRSQSLGQDFETIRESEVDMGLGNGGLGRLAACFLDSLATLDYPALGYGIHYEFGLFKQEFRNGHQVEHARQLDALRHAVGNRAARVHAAKCSSTAAWKMSSTTAATTVPRWVGHEERSSACRYDIPIPGYGTKTVNFLRLWESQVVRGVRFRGLQPRRLRRGGARKGRRARRSRRCFTRTTRPRTARSCASCSSISSSPARCATSSAAFPQARRTRGTTFPTRSRSSSTTRIRRSRSSS